MNEVKIKLSQVPSQYHNQMFVNLMKLRGFEDSAQAIIEDVTLSAAFPWLLTDEGHKFWQAISEGKTPKPVGVSATGETLEQVVQEAERRGFANGVNTKWGLIKDEYKPGYGIQPHELLPDGTFFYRNIKVRTKKGKWLEPIPKTSKLDEANQDAIHAMIKQIIERINPN